MDPCFKYNLKMSLDSQNIKCLMAFCHTCLINYKNKNKLAAFHDTKLAILKQLKFFYKNSCKINYFKNNHNKKTKNRYEH